MNFCRISGSHPEPERGSRYCPECEVALGIRRRADVPGIERIIIDSSKALRVVVARQIAAVEEIAADVVSGIAELVRPKL